MILLIFFLKIGPYHHFVLKRVCMIDFIILLYIELNRGIQCSLVANRYGDPVGQPAGTPRDSVLRRLGNEAGRLLAHKPHTTRTERTSSHHRPPPPPRTNCDTTRSTKCKQASA